MSLRPYQQQCLAKIRENREAGVHRQLVVAATGTGKTAILSNLPQALGIRRMLVLAHRDELLQQAAEKLRHWNPGLKVGIEAGSRVADGDADVVVGSVATLGRAGSKRLAEYPQRWPQAIVVDEAHHATSTSYRNIFDYFGLLQPENRTLLLGVTATPFRSDGEDLGEIFERVAFDYGLRPAIEDGWLCDVRGLKLRTEARLDRVKQRAGDFAADELAAAVNTPERNAGIVKAWLQHADKRPTLAFTVDIQHAQDLAAEFRKWGVGAEAVWGEDPERSLKLQRFRNRETPVLANCALLTEGFDAPLTSCVIMARPTRSQGLYLQCIGRGTRLADEKPDLLVLDVVDLSSRFSLASVAGVMGLPEDLDLNGGSANEAAKYLERMAQKYPRAQFAGVRDLADVEAIAEQVDLFAAGLPPEIAAHTEMRWHKTNDGFVLWLPDRQAMRITTNLLGHHDLISRGAKFHEAKTLEEAIVVAEGWVKEHEQKSMNLLKQGASWHDQPASPKQLKLLTKRYGRHLPANLTKGAASDLIGRLLASSPVPQVPGGVRPQ
jgi:superfamily II DNA or RNA helicase